MNTTTSTRGAELEQDRTRLVDFAQSLARYFRASGSPVNLAFVLGVHTYLQHLTLTAYARERDAWSTFLSAMARSAKTLGNA